jgi:hypothetical protein
VRVALCCSEPDVAVTVTNTVCAGEDDPPHPVKQVTPKAANASSRNVCAQRRFFQPSQQRPAASGTPGKSGPELCRTSAIAAEVEIVRVVVAAAPAGITLAGEKLHDAPDGSPEQLNETAEANPFCGVMDTVVVPLDPDATVSAVGESETLKSGAGRLMV